MKKIDTILEFIKQERKTKKISQKEMADLLKIGHETYRDIESGRIAFRVETLLSICKVLKIDPLNVVKDTNEIIIVISPEQAEAINDLNKQIQNAINFNNIQNNTFNGDFIIGNKYGDK